MVKRKIGGGKRYKAAANGQAHALPQPEKEGPAPPLHVQKKLARKVNFLTKVSDTASKLALNKLSSGVSKKLKRKKPLPDLSSLGAVLEEEARRASERARDAVKRKQRGTAVKSAKERQYILKEESKRLQQVLHHKLYKEDPIAAITNHLRRTLPPPTPAKPPGPKAAQHVPTSKRS
ncbi:hypothetical protein VaNZ11_014738 [Volvox africanus]|uniref:Ribosome biogenesis protein SLX9 n=1 Tax=Volvox africanus TaxID=51714 RepID=A0ABQ5SJQ9_9CHLO|nr:hypothetical protein VaNZ11_014738 [Volvox africanus]